MGVSKARHRRCKQTLHMLLANPQVSFIHAGKVHESDQSIEVDPVEVTPLFLKLTLAVTTFPSPLVARRRHRFLPSLVPGYELLTTTTYVG